jgi:hypothetical protein
MVWIQSKHSITAMRKNKLNQADSMKYADQGLDKCQRDEQSGTAGRLKRHCLF